MGSALQRREIVRGEVYLLDYSEGSRGAEMQKLRPALVIQNDVGNKYSSTTIVAAITSTASAVAYPTNVSLRKGVGGLDRDSVVRLDQIRTVDSTRLLKRLGKVPDSSMRQVNHAIALSLGLVDI